MEEQSTVNQCWKDWKRNNFNSYTTAFGFDNLKSLTADASPININHVTSTSGAKVGVWFRWDNLNNCSVDSSLWNAKKLSSNELT